MVGDNGFHFSRRVEALLAKAAEIQGDEAFERDWYWTSTQCAASGACAWVQGFDYGDQYHWLKDDRLRGRAVRRVAI